jgi:protein SCO1
VSAFLEIASFCYYEGHLPFLTGREMPGSDLNNAPSSRAFAVGAIVTVVAVIGLGLAALSIARFSDKPRTALIGGAFALQDGEGKTISDQSLRGRPFLVYFGYTHCPDVCPTELARISDILTEMGDKSIPSLFITVDPERDTPKIMQDYVSSFNPRIIGLSGPPQAIESAERAYRVFARKGQPQADGDYSMDHSSVVYLMDKNGAFVEAFNVERPPKDAAKELERFL